LASTSELGRPLAFGRALDVGCGLGRVTRALSARFGECVGVDIADRMVERARELNGDRTNCTFVSATDLSAFVPSSFDLVYSRLVLQHLPSPAAARRLIGELLRVTSSDGLAVFQVPRSIPARNRLQFRRRLWTALRAAGVTPRFAYERLRLHPIGLIAVPEDDVRATVERAGAVVGLVEPDDQAAPPARSFRYFAWPAQAP
jgi:SAM-dependent methyltransferase